MPIDHDEDLKLRLWNVLPSIANDDPMEMRIDRLDNRVRYADFNDASSRYGWGRSWSAGGGHGPQMSEALHLREITASQSAQGTA